MRQKISRLRLEVVVRQIQHTTTSNKQRKKRILFLFMPYKGFYVLERIATMKLKRLGVVVQQKKFIGVLRLRTAILFLLAYNFPQETLRLQKAMKQHSLHRLLA